MSKLIDPIVVKEEQKRLNYYKEAMALGVLAGDALNWFKEYALGKNAKEVINIKITPIAFATLNANVAEHYFNQAIEHYAAQIILAAIELAQQEFDQAIKIRKKFSEIDS